MLELQVIMATFSQVPSSWFAVSIFALLIVMLACSIRFGGSGLITLGDIALVVVLELSTPVLLRSPLDFAHLHGNSLMQWSVALGTAIAILAILMHHQIHQG